MPPMSTPVPKPERILLPADENVVDFYAYLKNRRADKGMESILQSDMEIFYKLMNNPNQYSIEAVEDLFSLLEQLARTESFESQELAREVVNQIDHYRTELGL